MKPWILIAAIAMTLMAAVAAWFAVRILAPVPVAIFGIATLSAATLWESCIGDVATEAGGTTKDFIVCALMTGAAVWIVWQVAPVPDTGLYWKTAGIVSAGALGTWFQFLGARAQTKLATSLSDRSTHYLA